AGKGRINEAVGLEFCQPCDVITSNFCEITRDQHRAIAHYLRRTKWRWAGVKGTYLIKLVALQWIGNKRYDRNGRMTGKSRPVEGCVYRAIGIEATDAVINRVAGA